MSFKLTHIVANKDDFTATPKDDSGELSIVREKPDINLLLDYILKVGEDSKWDKRTVYHDPDYINDLKDRIEKTRSSLFLFKKGDETVGFCQALESEGMSGHFNTKSGAMAAEIYKVGLFPEHCGKGLGNFYVSSVLAELFKENEVVYLNTRDTNKVNSVPFYERLGMKVVGEEDRSDDYIPEQG